MTRVVATFAFFTLVYPLAAFVAGNALGFGGALAVAGITTLGMLGCGVPAFLLVRRRGWLEWWQLAFGGALIGLVCTLPFAVGGAALVGALAPAFFALGVLHGLLFWVLAIWRNTGLPRRSTLTPAGDA
jgi:hypothetical protein